MSTLDEIRTDRLRKRSLLEAAGMDPYAASTKRTHEITAVLSDFDTLADEAAVVTIAGRIMAYRAHGGSIFIDIDDGTGRIQVFFSRDTIGLALFDLFKEAMDTGDFVEVTGAVFTTKRGAEAIEARGWTVLTKTLQNIPTEHFGIKDEDERYRKRYLDMLLDPELREVFALKARFWESTRNFLKSKGFLEVETPTIEVTTGGAEARPFATHHNDYDMEVYMRISIGELWQKRLMAAGYPKTFEIGKAYRNEGTSPEHLQEFTNMEFYWAYADYQDGMKLVQEMYRTIAMEVFGTTTFTTRGHTFDLADEWQEIDYVTEIKDRTGIDVTKATEVEMAATAAQLGIKFDGNNRERLTDTLWKYCRKQIAGPAFLMNHPLIVAPLAKQKEGASLAQMFQPIIAGSEVGRGYSELNDPVDQAERFKKQQELLDAGDDEAMMPDWEFVEMLEFGMPPTCGFGFGERMFAFLADKPLRETQMFPLMKPKEVTTKSKGRKVAVALLNRGADMETWQRLNTVAHLSAKLGVVGGKALQKYDAVETQDGEVIPLNIQHGIVIKETASSTDLRQVLKKARTQGLLTTAFTREMLESTNDKKIKEQTAGKDAADIEYLGVLIFGTQDEVRLLTDAYPLIS